MSHLTPEQRRIWTAKGFVIVQGMFAGDPQRALAAWIREISEAPEPFAQRLHYFEQTASGRALCRTERFVEDHAAVASLTSEGLVPQIAAELLGEPVRLYKEKINYKPPGGGGYAPHQDAAAYAFAKKLVTCLVAIDDMTPENGCLEFAPHAGTTLLPATDGCVDPAVVADLPWECVPLAAGSAVYFTAHVPHRSAGNRSDDSRRALYLTYHAAAEGPLREAYYAWRAQAIAAAAAGGKARVSASGDFLGRIVP